MEVCDTVEQRTLLPGDFGADVVDKALRSDEKADGRRGELPGRDEKLVCIMLLGSSLTGQSSPGCALLR